MTNHNELTLWDKVDPDLASTRSGSPRSSTSSAEPKSLIRRTRFIALDIFASILWLYAASRTFLGDIDRWILNHIAPGFEWVLHYRALGFLLLAAAFGLVARRRFRWVPLYVILFPLVVLFWRLPKLLYRKGSWNVTFGVVHLLIASLRSARFALVGAAVIAFSGLAILNSAKPTLLIPAVLALMGLWLASIWKAFRYSMTPTRFVNAQRRFIDRILDSPQFWDNVVKVDDDLRDPSLETLSENQTQELMNKAGHGLIVYEAARFLATRLDEYRKSGASTVFSFASILGLLAQAVITFTLANLAVVTLAPAQYEIASNADVGIVAYYSFTSLFVTEVSAMSPTGGWAISLYILAGISTAVILMIVLASLFFGLKQSKVNIEAESAIQEMRRRADEFAGQLYREHEVPLSTLKSRLEELGWGLIGFLAYLASERDSE